MNNANCELEANARGFRKSYARKTLELSFEVNKKKRRSNNQLNRFHLSRWGLLCRFLPRGFAPKV